MTLRDLFVRIGIDADENKIKRIDKGIDRIKGTVRSLTFAIMGTGGLGAAFGFLLKKGGDLEQTQIAFETMLGSAQEAKELLSDLFTFAATTPFEIPGLLKNTKLLLGMGIEQENMIETLTHLGNVASGLSIPIERLALNYGQVKAQTKLTGRELRDFAIAGVPLLKVLSETLGKSEAQVQDMVSAGEIGFPLVEQAFRQMATEGGRFANLMQRQSRSLFGLWSNLKDAITILSQEIGKKLLPNAKRVVEQFIAFLEANKNIIKTKSVEFIESLSKAFWMLFKGVKAVFISAKDLIKIFGGLERVIKFVTLAMAGFLAMRFLSGIGEIALGVAGLITKFITLGTAAKLSAVATAGFPLIIGVAIAALALVLEDIYRFFKGDDSITGLIVDAFKKKYPEAIEYTKKKLKEVLELFKKVGESILHPETTTNELGQQVQRATGDTFPQEGSWWDKAKYFLKNIRFGHTNMPPSSYKNITNSPNVSVNAPITVNVPEGTPAQDVGPRIQAGVDSAIDKLLRQTHWETLPQVDY